MDADTLKKLIKVLNTSNDKNVILKVLVKLRTDLVKNKNGIKQFAAAGGITPITRFLHKPHEQILETTLSILGNCCTEPDCCKEALGAKIMNTLSVILKTIPNPLVQCRACRLLGNLAKYNVDLLNYAECAVVAKSLCQILDETSDENTRLYAFRAIRILLTKSQFFTCLMESNGLVSYLKILEKILYKGEYVEEAPMPVNGLKNNQHRENYFQEVVRSLDTGLETYDSESLTNANRTLTMYEMPEKRDVFDELLKGLLAMSFNFYQCKLKIWQTLHQQKSTLAPIQQLFKEKNYRSQALRILSNFTKNKNSYFLLNSANIIPSLCAFLTTPNVDDPITDNERRYCLNIIGFLSGDALNRLKFRRSGCLPTLLAILKDTKIQTEKSLVLNILSCFEYDNVSLDYMFKKGLVKLLVRELAEFLNNLDEVEKNKKDEKQQKVKKRKLKITDDEDTKHKLIKTQEEEFFNFGLPWDSPRSSIESPCSSRSTSPLNSWLYNHSQTLLDDDTSYSPVCSDEEGDEEEAPENINENSTVDNNIPSSDYLDILKLLDISESTETIDDNILDKEEFNDEESRDIIQSKSTHQHDLPPNCIDMIGKLLMKATAGVHKSVDLVESETMFTLLKAVRFYGGNNNFSTALTNIILETRFFVCVIQIGIIQEIHKLFETEELHKDALSFFETLTCVGESNYGKSELARLLKFGDPSSQAKAAIATAYVIKSNRLLQTFLNEGNVLKILFDNILTENSTELASEAVNALTFMCINTLDISRQNGTTLSDYELYNERTESLYDKDMIFQISKSEDNSIVEVPFNKKLLCDASDVFNSMLHSDFREGNEGKISLTTATVGGLKYFLNLIVRISQQQKLTIPSANKDKFLLEAFEMSRIYIIPTLETELLNMLFSTMDPTSCLSLFEWSIKNYHVTLMEETINYYLCAKLPPEIKVKLFCDANNSTFKKEWNNMIRDTILDRF
ncbi:uncharacterized protein LOC119680719 [Teleopsis dalmanni]|uniref:uncharacterized protein LOC119680719 n=1 Tax=Teleopsis dalmanni TaxID=139649 RepID=UPI0018CE1D8A|nr:uncharacterized protein LOC119680719 [Teleopsis dalmanni]